MVSNPAEEEVTLSADELMDLSLRDLIGRLAPDQAVLLKTKDTIILVATGSQFAKVELLASHLVAEPTPCSRS